MMQVLRQFPRNSKISAAVRAGGDQRLAHHAADGGAHETRLIEQGRDLQIRRQALLQDRQLRQQVTDDVQGRSAAVLDDGHQHSAFAVLAHDVGLRRESVAHMSDFRKIDRRAVARHDRNAIEPIDRIRGRIGAQHVLSAADLGGSGRQDQILRINRIDDIVRSQSLRQQRRRVEIDRYDALLAAERPRYGDARNGHQSRAQEIHRRVEHRLLGHRRTRKTELDHRNGRCGVLDHQRRQGAGRHLTQLRLFDRHDLRNGRRNVGIRLKENLDDRDTRQRLGFDVLDVVDGGGQAALVDRRDAQAHLLGG